MNVLGLNYKSSGDPSSWIITHFASPILQAITIALLNQGKTPQTSPFLKIHQTVKIKQGIRLGQYHSQARNYLLALSWLIKALHCAGTGHESEVNTRNLLAKCYISLNWFDRALLEIDNCLKISPTHVESLKLKSAATIGRNKHKPTSCNYCQKPLVKAMRCGRCNAAFYCNRDCQKNDWKTHKPSCKDT